jgi:uncharacterized protein involved in outer membrane biogenesis
MEQKPWHGQTDEQHGSPRKKSRHFLAKQSLTGLFHPGIDNATGENPMTFARESWNKLAWWQKLLAVGVSCVALYAAFGFLLLPRIVRYVLVEKVSPALNRQVGVSEIRFNPFALTADVTGFTIAEKDGNGEFVAFDALHANVELSSLIRLAVVVRDLRLDGPRINIRLDQEGRTNYADLAGGAQEPAPEKSEPLIVPLIIEPVTVGNGTIVFEDQARGVTHVVDAISFQVPQFSSRKKDWTTSMTPTLSFRVNGAPFNLQGQTTPFHNSLKTEFNLNVVDLGLPQYWAYALASENLKLAKGTLNLENKLVFERYEGRLPTFSLQGTITGRDIELTDDGEPVLSAASTEIVLDDISILNLQLGLRSVSLERPFIKLVRKKDGSLNWMGYFTREPAPANATAETQAPSVGRENATTKAPVAAAGADNATQTPVNATAQAGNATAGGHAAEGSEQPARTLLLQIPEVRLSDGRVLFRDETLQTPFTKEIQELNLTITDLSTAANATTQAALKAMTADGEELGVDGSFSVSPVQAKARVSARNLDVPSYAAYFKDALPMALASAKVVAGLGLVMDAGDRAPRLEDSTLEVRDLLLKAAGEAGAVQVGRLALDGIFVDLAVREVRTGILRMDGASVSTGVDKNGRAAILDALNTPSAPPAADTPATAPEGGTPAWRVASQGAALTGIDLRVTGEAAATPVRLGSLKVGPVSVDTAQSTVAVGPVDMSLAVDVTRLKTGDIDLAALFAPAPGVQTAPPPAPTKAQAPAWKVNVEQFTLSGSQVAFTDQTLDKPVRLDIDQIAFKTANLSNDLTKAIPLDLSCRIEETGTVKATGDLVPSTLVTKGTLNLSKIPLSLASAYVAEAAAVDIPAGLLGGKLEWRMGEKGKERISGSLLADGLRVTEGRSKTEIFGFRSLGVQNLALNLAPLTLSIKQVDLVEPRGSFVIDGQGKTTLDRVKPAARKPSKPQPKAAAKTDDKSEGLKSLEIGVVTLKQGRFTFADKTLSPQFESVVAPVDLTVTGFSLDPNKRAELDLTAIIDGSAPITAKGWISPLKDPVEANSTVTLQNLDLVALSPYSSKFIAYPVARGQLDWVLNLNTEGSTLDMKNAIKARQLELGDKVESPGAADVPVKMGLALLRDMSGDITINLPVKGDLNDPQFSIGGIVMQAFLGLIVKAIASPFTLLASLVPDGGGEDMGKLAFPAGLAVPGPETMQRMQGLADVLGQRPGLRISLAGHADPKGDRQAMADMQFRRKLQVIKFDDLPRKVREKTVLEELEITDEEYPDLLWEAYKDEPVEKEKNAIGLHKEVSRDVQEAKLRELINVTDEDLVRLAASRAEFVKNHMVQTLKLDAGRVFMGQTGPAALSGASDVTVEVQN